MAEDKLTQSDTDAGKPQVMYSEKCSKCGQTISGISQNTLGINMALHLKKHQLEGE